MLEVLDPHNPLILIHSIHPIIQNNDVCTAYQYPPPTQPASTCPIIFMGALRGLNLTY